MGRSIAIAVIAAALSLAAASAHAAGLGRLTVLSPLGQALNAEIEIVSLQPGEEDGLVARMASSDAFKQAGIEFNPVLTGVRFAVERRDGRPILRIRTTQPVSEPFLDLMVELQWNSGRLVREYTFLLDPPEYKEKAQAAIAAAPPAAAPAKPAAQPTPAAPAPSVEAKPIAPSPSPSPSASVPAAAKAANQHEVKKGDTLASIARQHVSGGVSLNQMLIAIYRANQDAFIRDNINLVRAGRILNIPDSEAVSGVTAEDANRLVQSQMSEFAQYRSRLASAPASADGSRGQREVAGRIEAKPGAEPPAGAQDQLRLSKADPQKPEAAGSRAARGDERVAQERAAKEAESRVSDLEKNVADLQKLLALKNEQLAQLEQKGGAKPAPTAPGAPAAPATKGGEAPKPAAEPAKPAAPAPQPGAEAPKAAVDAANPVAEAPKPGAESPNPGAETPKAAAEAAAPGAEAPKPPVVEKKDAPKPAPAKPAVKKGPPPPEPSLIDELLSNPLYLGLLGAVVLLLVGYGAYAWRRKKASQAQFSDSVLGAASSAGAMSASPSVIGTPSQAAVAAPSASLASISQPAGMAAEEVDPIAEADVYMAYGRDAQAEEILKEALQKDPPRVPVLAKLCEIYATRRDTKSFEQMALKLKGLTHSAGPEWDKVAALGRSIEPQNGLYSGGVAAAGAAAAVAAAAPAAPALDFDLGGSPSQTTMPDITLDAGQDGAATIDFDLGAATTPAASSVAAGKKDESDFTPEGTLIMGANSPEHTVSGLDFDLGLDSDEKKPAPPSAPTPAPVPSEASGLDFDLNLDLGMPGDKPDEDKSAPAAMDLSSISLDLGSAGEPSGDTSGDPKWQEVATKLDLAKAYEEMGDKDGARELLNEVVKDGDAAQQGQAQQLLAKLG